MRIVGITAEYNPFHQGHAWQASEARRRSGADYVIAVMSPDFVQSGDPALADKYTRTCMALHGGIDLVLELPVSFACASAETFAAGAVRIFHALGCVSQLSFGTENEDLSMLETIAGLLCEEPEDYRQVLTEGLRRGLGFPAARAAAVCSVLGEAARPFLEQPNNILALEYLKAARRLDSPLTFLPVKRRGSYHSLEGGPFASATAIREKLRQAARTESETDPSQLLSREIPEAALPPLAEYLSTEGPSMLAHREERLDLLLRSRLLSVCHLQQIQSTLSADAFDASRVFSSCLDVSPALSSRICRLLPSYETREQFVELLLTKDQTRRRIRRGLLHILLDIQADQTAALLADPDAAYVRILGFRKEAGPLLRHIRKHARLPVITKPADGLRTLTGPARASFQLDLYASDLYRLLGDHPDRGGQKLDIQKGPVIT
ncbi:MAG: nucleotidyltransferase family protein [Lachnospiraceae bacterium]|nr:nucleotidyltransferase family protein [Lachnospiraceae bacterium]